ncbi:MAG TPA: IPT/TIG domain-containing protein [Acidimicrobiales bacterium]|nr:IPT/TIG domain-containing protein [Acidimicrobiales bacterium]
MNNPRRIQRHLVKALAAGAVLVAAALPMAIASVAGASTFTPAGITFTPHTGAVTNEFGTGASGTFVITGSGFAADGSTTTVTSTAPGLTFSGAAEPAGGGSVTGSFASTAATVPGTYSITVTDDTGPTTVTGAIIVDANSTVTTVSPATPVTQANGNITTPTTVTITGSGFVTGAKVTFQNSSDGTSLASADTAAHITAGVAGANQGTTTFVSSTSLTAVVSPTNSITGATEAAGTYNVIVVNPDGGTTVVPTALTVIPYGVSSVTPSALVPTATSTNTAVTIAGAGFQPGATVAITGGADCNAAPIQATVASSSVVSPTSITAVFSEVGTIAALCGVTVTNPSIANGGNAATFALPGAFGIGEASTVAPTITATNATTPLVPGAAATTVTLTGTGLSQYSTAAAFVGTTAVAGGVTLNNPSGNTGTAVTFNVSAANGATAGPFNVVVSNTAAHSNAFPAAVSVAGPVITSQTPTGLAVGAPVGTVVTLTGTGFTNTTTGTVTDHGGVLQGIISYVSATTMNLVLTVSPTAADLAGPPSIQLSQIGAVVSPVFTMTIDAAPSVSGLTYAVGSDVGVGATAQVVKINGSGFATGVTVGSFVNGNSVADPNVTATVTSVNLAGTQITATIAIKGPDTNIADGYSVTNTDGGVVKVPATLTALVIGPGPTVTAVSPTPGLASATNAFTITGTGFLTGVVVSATSDGTCGAATVVSATSITVSCTLGALQTTPVSLVVTNVDGGSATSAPVLTPSSTPPPPAPFRVTGAHGHAVPGKTVTMTISGSGFYGQPRITSTAAGTRVTVSKDSGHLLTIRVTTKAGTKHRSYTFTIRLANGKTGRANYVA